MELADSRGEDMGGHLNLILAWHQNIAPPQILIRRFLSWRLAMRTKYNLSRTSLVLARSGV